jgi:hypothetical protein
MPSYTDKQLEQALREAKGMKFLAATSLGCSHHTIDARLAKSAHLRAVIDEEQGRLVDLGELKLHQKVQEGDVGAIKYLLSSKAKDRGYGESTEVHITGGVDVDHRHSFGFGDFAALFAASVRPELPVPNPDRIIEPVDTPHSNGKASVIPDAAGS